MRPFMKSILLLITVVGLCLYAVQAATPVPTWGAPDQSSATVKGSSSTPTAAKTTLPTVAGLSADTVSTIASKTAKQATPATTSPTVRGTTPRASATAPTTAVSSTKANTPLPSATPTTAATSERTTTGSAPTPTADVNLTVPWPTDSLNATMPTPWQTITSYEYVSPTEDRTPDIDPGMTPYSGPTQIETLEPTPTWEGPVDVPSATPTDPSMMMPYFTAEVVQSPPFELPPGAYGVEQSPSPTETVAPLPISEPEGAAGSSFLPRWLSYLLFIFLGISSVAGIAVVGSYVGSRPVEGSAVIPAPLGTVPPRTREVRLLQPGAPEPTREQLILIDRIAGFVPESMHVERLGRNLLRLEHGAQVSARDRSVRLGQLLIFSAIPSAPVPAPATAWARTHGFRVLAVDGSGMALVMPALSIGGRSTLGVLPVGEMVEGASPVPMPVLLAGNERGAPISPVSPTGTGGLQGDAPDGI